MGYSSSSSSPAQREEYDVFLSFSGLDCRRNVISHLQAALKQNNFSTFKDDKDLDKGENIAAGLLEAIENSSMSIVVLSKNYFASTWCLCELEKIMDCSNRSQHIVLPVFVDIEPSDIRKLKGSIAETLATHKEKTPKMENWRAILTEVASVAGFVSSNYRDEASLVEDIVKEVLGKLNSGINLNVATHPVGIAPRLQKLLELLCLESVADVRIIAIWGVGGLGKTTIAKAAYNHIRSRFEGCSFVFDVRETWNQSNRDLLALQKQILSDISKNENYNIRNSHEGVEFLKRRVFYRRKVLLVLDDIDSVEQLNALAINPSFLYCGSRIIVTTRDISSLNSLQAVLTKYEHEPLNKDESLQLFDLRAFNQHNPLESFMEFSKTVVDYAGGIPLVLELLGAYLNGIKDHAVWKSIITKLEKIPMESIQRILKISFDSLDREQQKLFLDIACFFFGQSKNFTIQVLQDYGIFPEDGFQRLEDLCLIKCVGPKIVMHDILKQMGREIVRQESVDYPGKRSRIWDYKDALQVLKNCEGTEAVEGLILLPPKKKVKVNAKAFQNMKRLRVLHLDHAHLRVGYEHLSKNLTWLRWHHFDLSVLPSQLYLENLVVLDLSYSNIKQLWRTTKVLKKLTVLTLNDCRNLTTLSNLSGLSNLEKLDLMRCERLQEVDKSIGHLHKLGVLALSFCGNLTTLPSLSGLSNLETLDLVGCRSLQEVDKSIGHLHKLRVLLLRFCTNLTTLPSLSGLSNLETLDLLGCGRLQEVDKSIGHLHKLQSLNLECCRKLTTLPNLSGLSNLKKLELGECDRLQEVDKSIGYHYKLRVLSLNNCDSLRKVLSKNANMQSLEELMVCCSSSQCQTLTKKSTGSLRLSQNFATSLRCLKILEVRCCSLIQLPFEIGSIISLTKLQIEESNIDCLLESICNLTKLESLKITNCSVSNLPGELGRLNRLRVLCLDGNNFCRLPESISDLTNLDCLSLSDCERLQSLPKLSSRGVWPCLLDVSNCRFMNCWNCPKLDGKYFAHKFGPSFLNYKGALSFSICHSGGTFPDWLQHETTNSYYTLKVPPLGVGNRHFIRCIFHTEHPFVHTNYSLQNAYGFHNKTKQCYYDIAHSYFYWPFFPRTSFEGVIVSDYISFDVDKLNLEEGDEIKIFQRYNKGSFKKWRIHVSYYTIDDHHL